MRKVVAAALLISGSLAGCVVESRGSARPYNINKEASAQTVCRDERPTGTAIVHRVCRTPEQRAEDEAARQSWMNHYPPTPLWGDTTYHGVDARHPQPDEPEGAQLPPWTEPPEDPEGVNQPPSTQR